MEMPSLWLLALALLLLLPFPLYLGLLLLRRPVVPQAGNKDHLPKLSVIVVARDAADLIEAKLRNLLAQDYPPQSLEILLYTDGCKDDTAARARAVSRGILVMESREGQGKIHGMNQAAARASGQVLIFSDADALLAPQALRRLAGHFSDPAIGGICGRRVIATHDGQALHKAQAGYFDLDSRIKLAENALGSISSNDGKLYALRASLFQPLPEAVTDDLYAALQVVAQGQRFLFDPEVVCRVDLPSRNLAHELERRRRIVSTSLRGIWRMRALLNPLRFGRYSAQLFLNKVMRRLMPVGLLPLGLAIALAAPYATLGLMLTGLVLAAARPCLQASRTAQLHDRIAYPMVGFLGTLWGLLDLLLGRAPRRWNPRGKKAHLTANGTPRVAYTMSRFPKLTETFVLYEIREMQRLGIDVTIFPLLLEREHVRHPEVESLMPGVRFAPFLNLAVIRANLCWLFGSPAHFAAAWRDALRSAWPNRNFLLGALGVLPKAALYARQMQQQNIGHVHAHFATHAALAARFIHALTGIPYSFTAHGHDVHISLQGFDAKARDARFWVTISQYNLDLIRERFGPGLLRRAHLVHCGIDLERIEAQDPPDPADGFNILCVASFKEVKGHRYLVEACAQLAKQGVAFHCHLIGDGPLRSEVEERIRSARLTEYFTLHGQQPQPRVLAAMRASNVVVLPSILASRGDREGIPVCLMEAMASARPVLSSRLSGIPELVRSGVEGILVPQKDGRALAAALFQLAQDPELCRRMGRAGRARVEQKFGLQENTAQLAGLLRRSFPPQPNQIAPFQGSERNTRKAL